MVITMENLGRDRELITVVHKIIGTQYVLIIISHTTELRNNNTIYKILNNKIKGLYELCQINCL